MANTRTAKLRIDLDEAVKVVGPLGRWPGNCHGVSLALVQAGLVPGGRVARGRCLGITSQHSWIVAGDDCYDPRAQIIDPTLWGWRDDVEGIWYGTLRDGWHRPHGAGSIWEYGQPTHQGGETIALVHTGLSLVARNFLDLIEPLDRQGWNVLIHAPMEGWPSKEIITRICETPSLTMLVPIDIEGMVTDRNPGGLYR